MITNKKKRLARVKVYSVQNLNPQKRIYSSLRVDETKKEYVVCLCIANKTTKTVFPTAHGAMKELRRYQELYQVLEE